jgi:hypothetical protein
LEKHQDQQTPAISMDHRMAQDIHLGKGQVMQLEGPLIPGCGARTTTWI